MTRRLVATASAALLLRALPAAACSVCFGDPASPMSRGAEMGVWFLLAVVLAVEAGFAGFAYYLFKRARDARRRTMRPALRLVKNTREAPSRA